MTNRYILVLWVIWLILYIQKYTNLLILILGHVLVYLVLHLQLPLVMMVDIKRQNVIKPTKVLKQDPETSIMVY